MYFLLLLMSILQQNWRKGQNRFCLEVRAVWGEREGTAGRNGPNNVCTYELKTKKKSSKFSGHKYIGWRQTKTYTEST
jgi:hypothetical protein